MYQGESSWGTGQQKKKKGKERMQNYNNDFQQKTKGEERQHKKNRVQLNSFSL